MPGSNAIPFKTALVSLLKSALATAGPTGGAVQVMDAYNARLAERELVYVGKILGPMAPMTFRNGQELPREENLIVELHLEVALPDSTTIDADKRLDAIGTLIEVAMATDPTNVGSTVPGLLSAVITHSDSISFYMEDGRAASQRTYQISVQSKLG